MTIERRVVELIQQNEFDALVKIFELSNELNLDINTLEALPLPILHAAVNSKNPAVVRLILEHPAINVNLADQDGLRPVHLAATLEKSDILTLLLERGILNLKAAASLCKDCV